MTSRPLCTLDYPEWRELLAETDPRSSERVRAALTAILDAASAAGVSIRPYDTMLISGYGVNDRSIGLKLMQDYTTVEYLVRILFEPDKTIETTVDVDVLIAALGCGASAKNAVAASRAAMNSPQWPGWLRAQLGALAAASEELFSTSRRSTLAALAASEQAAGEIVVQLVIDGWPVDEAFDAGTKLAG